MHNQILHKRGGVGYSAGPFVLRAHLGLGLPSMSSTHLAYEVQHQRVFSLSLPDTSVKPRDSVKFKKA